MRKNLLQLSSFSFIGMIDCTRKLLQIAMLIFVMLCSFNRANAATYLVTNTNDAGAGSLRQAISDADANSGSDIIDATGVTGTITLTTGQLSITDGVTIAGPGANILSVSGNNSSRVFQISGGVTVNINNLTITGGNVSDNGGGIFVNGGILNLNNSAVSNNSANSGAGISILPYNLIGSANITNSTISGNTANIGGGIFTGSDGTACCTLTITNSTISGNSAGSGGGIATYCPGFGQTTLTNCTLSGNTASSSGGGIFNQASVTLINSIVANSTGGDIVNVGGTTDAQYSLIEDGLGINGTSSNNLTGDPLLGPLANNGGPTPTMALLSGSPAIDQGSTVTGITTDQRGLIRPYDNPSIANASGGNGSDIGAYEVQDPCSVFTSNIVYVNAAVSGGSDGNSWASAFKTLQEALSAANTCSGITQIWVAKGTYYPDEGTGQTNNNVNSTFALKNGVAIYGGFAGTEKILGDRNWRTNITILSGDIDKDNTIANNAFHVTTGSGTDNTAILDGFTVTGGNAICTGTCGAGGQWGGGMLNISGSPTVSNCIFTGNIAAQFGGGMANITSSPVITNCTFSGNSYSLVIAESTAGGGMYNEGSSPSIVNCIFSGNSAVTVGGGIYNTSALIGIHTFIHSLPTITNCTFSGNSAYFLSSSSTGGGIGNDSSGSPSITNCIFWNNRDNSGTGTSSSSVAGTFVISYSLVQGQTPSGTGNLDGTNPANNPLFVTAVDPTTAPTAAGDLHLQTGSPAINAGTNTGAPSTDIEGNPRPLTVANPADMGAYEFQCITDPIVINNNDAGPGSLRQAVLDACPGSTITFANSVISPILLSGGQIIIDKNLTIQGPGANTLTIQNTAAASTTSRIFYVNAGVTATISGVTITGGNTTSTGFVAAAGGGIYNNGSLTLLNSILKDNTSSYGGGAILNYGGNLTVNSCTITGSINAIRTYASVGSLPVTIINNSTITGNSYRTIQNDFGTLTMTNCTVTGNTLGPGIYNGQFGGSASLYNCTITGNTNDIGSGIYNTGGSFYIKNTIVAGNIQTITSVLEPDITGSVISGGYNLIGNIGATPFTPTTGDLVGTTANPINPLFDPLGLKDNGNTGGVQTIALLPGSPAINTGTNTGAPANDERGIARPQQSTTDIGAFESQGFTMAVSGGNNQSTIVSTAFTNPLTVNVSSAFNEPVDGGLVTFTAPVTGASATIAGNPATITSGVATTGAVSANSIVGGPYTVTASSGTLSTSFSLTNVSACITNPIVTTNSDAGPGSLRQVVIDACPGSTITFDMSQVISPISLAGGQIIIDKNLTIQGPGVNLLTVQNTEASSANSRVFYVNSNITATISDLTISGGNIIFANPGGGICNFGNLTVNSSTISNNSTSDGGGGIYSTGTLMVVNTTVSGNYANAGGTGGGILIDSGTATISNSTISGNDAIGQGGGIRNNSTLKVINSTIFGNGGTLVSTGGGIYNAGTLTVSSTTISGNSAFVAGGGIYNSNPVSPGSLTKLGNSIVALNTAQYGPDIFGSGELILTHNDLLGTSSSYVLASPTNLIGLNPMLGPLHNNGGPTKTMALNPASPAINAAASIDSYLGYSLTTDQRGIARPSLGGYDIGAFEQVQTGPTSSVLSVDGPSTICNGSSANLIVTITGGTSPYTVMYTDGSNNFTVNNYTSGSDITVSPVINTTYSLVSVTDAVSYPGTGNIGTAAITVNPVPTLGQITASSVCDGGSVVITLPGVGTGGLLVTVNYTINNVAQTPVIVVINPDGSVNFNTRILTYALDNNQILEVSNITFNGTGCTNIFHTRPGNNTNNNAVTLTVNPTPTATISGTTAICNGQSTNLSIQFTGTAPFIYSINSGTPVVAINNPETVSVSPSSTTGYSVTSLYDANCTASSADIAGTATISVNPRPTAIISGTTAICNGQNTNLSIQFTGTAPFTYIINYGTPVVASNNPETVSVSPSSTTGYSITSLADANCTAITGDFTGIATVVVNPTPTAIATPSSQIICSGSSITTIALTGSVGGTVFSWTRDNTVSVTGIAANGTGNISGALTNSTALPITVTFTITPTANGCTGASVAATVLVNPTPNAIATPSTQPVCSGSSLTTIVLNGGVTGTVFNWTRDNTVSVSGIPASGAGNISGELTNSTAAPITVTFTITPTANGCNGTAITATVVVNPIPNAIATPSSQTICSGSSLTTIALIGGVSGTVYNWTRNNTVSVTGVAASGSGSISATLTNTTNTTQTVTFTITPVANGCAGTSITATVLIKPTPTVVATPSTQTICSGSSITCILLTGSLSGTTYNWTRNNTVVCSDIASSGTGNICGTLTNLITTPVLVTFTITPSFNGCTGTPITATVMVNPKTNISANPVNQSILTLGNASFSVTATGTSITYQWQISTNGGTSYNNLSNGGVYSGATNATLSLTVVPLSMNGYKYRCLVIGTCTKATSSAALLTVNNPCQNPTSLTTTNITSSGAKLNWSAVYDPVQWDVQYKTTNTGSVWIDLLLGGSQRSVTLSSLLANQSYNWHIRAKCGANWLSYTGSASFKTLIATKSESTITAEDTINIRQIQPNESFQVFPNPTRGEFTLILQGEDNINAKAKIKLVDMVGKTLYLEDAEMVNGLLKKTILTSSSFANGIYVVMVIIDEKLYTKHLILDK